MTSEEPETTVRKTPSRRGRPKAGEAGEVDTRIIAAATELFLAQGFERTTYDQVAAAAGASKTTLYKRYPAKADLFTATVTQGATTLAAESASLRHSGNRRERLLHAGRRLADLTLTEDAISLMRITSAEANTMPEMARRGFDLGFGDCVAVAAAALAGSADARDLEAATPLARRFVELALHPLYMHAFFGADLAHLLARAENDVREVVDHLLGVEEGDRVPDSG